MKLPTLDWSNYREKKKEEMNFLDVGVYMERIMSIVDESPFAYTHTAIETPRASSTPCRRHPQRRFNIHSAYPPAPRPITKWLTILSSSIELT